MKYFVSFCVALCLFTASSCAVPMIHINSDRDVAGLALVIEPETAKVFLDDRYIGRAVDFNGAHNRLELTRGGHVLRFEADGFQNERVEATATQGPTTLRVKLLVRPADDEKKD